MDSSDKRYDYNRFGMKGKRVGQAVADILSEDQLVYTSQDIIDGYSEKYTKEFQDTIEKNKHKYKDNFYVLVFSNKEMWAENVVRNWFVARETAPHATDMIAQYPHHMKTLYLVNAGKGLLSICWSLPGIQDILVILKNPSLYNEELVKWISLTLDGKLNLDSYEFSL